MRQTYYGVNNGIYRELEFDLHRYNILSREKFNSATDQEQKNSIQFDKVTLQESIHLKLKEEGVILGFLTLEQIEQLESMVHELNNSMLEGALGSNVIPKDQIEKLLGELMLLENLPHVRNLIFFLERAKQNNLNVVVWIM